MFKYLKITNKGHRTSRSSILLVALIFSKIFLFIFHNYGFKIFSYKILFVVIGF